MAALYLSESHAEGSTLENRFRSHIGRLSVDNARLSACLMQWKGVEPGVDFEAAVWRRIRDAQSADPRQWGLVPRGANSLPRCMRED